MMDKTRFGSAIPGSSTPASEKISSREIQHLTGSGASNMVLQQSNQLVAGFPGDTANYSQHNAALQLHTLNVVGDVTVNMNIIQSSVASRAVASSFRIIDLPVPNFIGRKDYQRKIHRVLVECSERNEEKKKEYSDRIVVLHGIGGIGKTELVRQYVKNHIDETEETNIFQNVAWINAETRDTIRDSFVELALSLYLTYENLALQEITSKIYTYLSDNIETFKSYLLIFDNVEQLQDQKPYMGIYNFLPTQQGLNTPLILIITKTSDWTIPEDSKKIIQINNLSIPESVEFFQRAFRLSEQQKNDAQITKAITKLAVEMQGYPLGISLAASNIGNRKVSPVQTKIKKYLKKLGEPKSGWIDHEHRGGAVTNYEFVMNNVLETTFDKIKNTEPKPQGESALKLLNLLTYVSADNLDLDTVQNIATYTFDNDEDYLTEIGILEKYSLISFITTSEDSIRIRLHRHVQRCTREKLDFSKDFFYLFAICKFFCRIKSKELMPLHNYLKQREWPNGSISFSVIFISIIIDHSKANDEETDNAFEIVRDVNEFLLTNQQYNEVLNERILILFQVWIFYFSMNKKYSNAKMFLDFSSRKADLQRYFVCFAKWYVESLNLQWLSRDNDEGKCFDPKINLKEPILHLLDSLQTQESSPTSLLGRDYINKCWNNIYPSCLWNLDEDVKMKLEKILAPGF